MSHLWETPGIGCGRTAEVFSSSSTMFLRCRATSVEGPPSIEWHDPCGRAFSASPCEPGQCARRDSLAGTDNQSDTLSATTLDSSTLDLCRSVFPWARFRSTKSGIKLHALLDLSSSIPSFVSISEAKIHEVNILDELIAEPDAIYVLDRAYLDFVRLYRMHLGLSYFILRAKRNTKLRSLYSVPVEKDTGVIFDQTMAPRNKDAAEAYPENIRRIKYHDQETGQRLVFLTNDFVLDPYILANPYR